MVFLVIEIPGPKLLCAAPRCILDNLNLNLPETVMGKHSGSPPAKPPLAPSQSTTSVISTTECLRARAWPGAQWQVGLQAASTSLPQPPRANSQAAHELPPQSSRDYSTLTISSAGNIHLVPLHPETCSILGNYSRIHLAQGLTLASQVGLLLEIFIGS